MAKEFDWETFHHETAARLIATLVGGFGVSTDEHYRPKQVETCIAYADELVKQLKEREQVSTR